MRKFILISALLLASAASVQAGETRSLSLAGVNEPAKPIGQVSMQLAQAATAPTETTAPAQTPATAEPKAELKPETKTTETKPAKPVKKVRRETNEQKARRIAARYGVYW
jgi:outer membrane biosynthesis protein TonB